MARQTQEAPDECRMEVIEMCRLGVRWVERCGLNPETAIECTRKLLDVQDMMRFANVQEQRNQPARKPAA